MSSSCKYVYIIKVYCKHTCIYFNNFFKCKNKMKINQITEDKKILADAVVSVTVQFKSVLTATRVIAFGILTEMNTTPVIIDALIDFFKIRGNNWDTWVCMQNWWKWIANKISNLRKNEKVKIFFKSIFHCTVTELSVSIVSWLTTTSEPSSCVYANGVLVAIMSTLFTGITWKVMKCLYS